MVRPERLATDAADADEAVPEAEVLRRFIEAMRFGRAGGVRAPGRRGRPPAPGSAEQALDRSPPAHTGSHDPHGPGPHEVEAVALSA